MILNFSHKPIIYGTLASFFSKSKVINVVTGIGHIFSLKKFFTIKILKFLYRIIEYKFNFIIFQDQRDSIFFYKNNFITKKKNIVIIEGSGIETNKFKPNNNCLNSKKIVFTYFGRILPEKGIVEFIKAASILKKKNKNINFNLVGDFNKKLLNKKFVNFVLENIQNNVVKYSPHSNNIINEYKKTSCVVLPSYREGISRTLLEACALKKFVITTNVPGCSDVIKHNFNGFVCRPKSVISLSRSMSNFLKLNHNLIKKMQNRSRAIILRRFDEKIILKKFLEVIEKL